jgi:hypothetical protein
MNLVGHPVEHEDRDKEKQGREHSESTREDLSKRALRLKNFKKKIEQTKIFEIDLQELSKSENPKEIDVPVKFENKEVEQNKFYSQGGSNLIINLDSTKKVIGGVLEPQKTDNDDQLRKKFEDIRAKLQNKNNFSNMRLESNKIITNVFNYLINQN